MVRIGHKVQPDQVEKTVFFSTYNQIVIPHEFYIACAECLIDRFYSAGVVTVFVIAGYAENFIDVIELFQIIQNCGDFKTAVIAVDKIAAQQDQLNIIAGIQIRYHFLPQLEAALIAVEIGGEFMPPEYANTAAAKNGHGGIDYAMLDNFFKHLCHQGGQPVTLREGLAMSIPGLYAAESAKLGGKVLKIRYPWDADWTTAVE